jgi:hypothetical protein
MRGADVGCHVNGVFYGCLLYADDIILTSPSVFDLQNMLNICSNTGFALSLNLNCNKCHCLCLGGYHKFSFSPTSLGLNKIDWCAQVTYLSVVIKTGKSISSDITQTKC